MFCIFFLSEVLEIIDLYIHQQYTEWDSTINFMENEGGAQGGLSQKLNKVSFLKEKMFIYKFGEEKRCPDCS